MRKHLVAAIGILVLTMITSSGAFAGNPEAFNVTVSIAASADITVLSGIPVNFGTMNIDSEAVSSTAVVIKNSGSGSDQTYSLSLTNPAGWTAVTTDPGAEEYRLSAAFDSDGTLTWEPANHGLTTSSVASSATKFAGDQRGDGVPYNENRNLYLKMETPATTSSPSQKTITVTITAAVD